MLIFLRTELRLTCLCPFSNSDCKLSRGNVFFMSLTLLEYSVMRTFKITSWDFLIWSTIMKFQLLHHLKYSFALTMFIHFTRNNACDILIFLSFVYIYIKINYGFIQFVWKIMNRLYALSCFYQILIAGSQISNISNNNN